jgi:hypothetical protein
VRSGRTVFSPALKSPSIADDLRALWRGVGRKICRDLVPLHPRFKVNRRIPAWKQSALDSHHPGEGALAVPLVGREDIGALRVGIEGQADAGKQIGKSLGLRGSETDPRRVAGGPQSSP